MIEPTAVLGWGCGGGQLSPNCFVKKEDVFHGKSRKVATGSSIIPGMTDVILMLNSKLWVLMAKGKEGHVLFTES